MRKCVNAIIKIEFDCLAPDLLTFELQPLTFDL